MRKNLFIKLASIASTASFLLATVTPAQAWSIGIPKIFQQGAQKLAQMMPPPPDGGMMPPPPSGTYTPPPSGTFTPPPGDTGQFAPPPGGTYTAPPPPPDGGMMPPPNGTYTPPPAGTQPYPAGDCPNGVCSNNQQYPQAGTQPGMQPGMQPNGSMMQPGMTQPQQSCRINGVEMPGPCNEIQSFSTGPMNGPMNQPMNGQNMDQGKFGPQQFGQQQNNGQMMNGPQGMQGLKDMQRGVKQMEGNLKQFEKMMQQAEKKGQQITPELKEKITRARENINKVKTAKSAEEISDFNMDEFQQDIQSMEQERRQQEQDSRQLKDIQMNMKNATQGMKMFEKQMNQLTKKKIAVPAEIAENLQKIKTTIAAIQKAKTWDEVEAAGLENLQDLFMSLDESRMQLEMLSRWPQTVQQANREIKNMSKELKRTKSMVTKLAKQGIDLADEYSVFENAINKLKETLASAQAKVQSGSSEDAQEAFDLMENEFFGQMDDVWEANRIIQTMSNLGRFASDFKRGISDAKRQIAKLKRKKIDVTELNELLADAQAKGNEVIGLLKTKPIDEDAVMDGLQALEDARQVFDERVGELSGIQEIMPWDQGKQQFQSISSSVNLGQFIQKSTETTAEQPTE